MWLPPFTQWPLSKPLYCTYNNVGALAGVGTNLLGTDPNNTTNVLNTTSFRANGAIKQLSYGNGLQLTMGYTPQRQQPFSMKVGPGGSGTILNYEYQYTDADGKNNNRLRKITDYVDPNYTTTYGYDDYNRLTYAQATAYQRSYQYDRFGNLRAVSVIGAALYTLNYDNNATGAPATNRIASVTENGATQAFSYDAAGDLTAGDGMTYAYDGASRLSSVNNGALGQYGYDGDGMRVKKVEGGQSVFYVRSSKLGQVAFEMMGTSVQRAYVYAGKKQIALLSTDGQFYWSHTNHLNSARAMTDTAGNLVYKAQFDPHGQPLTEWSATGNTNLNTRKFTGYERDAATGLDYAGARTYTGGRGRFMQPDPKGVGAAKLRRPQSLNRYSYVENDPVNAIDPTGEYYELCDLARYWNYWGEAGWAVFFESICSGNGGGGEDPRTKDGGGRGGGSGQSTNPANNVNNLLAVLPPCRNVVNTAAASNGRMSIEDALAGSTWKQVDFAHPDWSKPLRDLGFTDNDVPDPSITLGQYLSRPGVQALTMPFDRANPNSGIVYIGPQGRGLTGLQHEQLYFHETLHLIFGSHYDIARMLGFPNDQLDLGSLALSRLIDDWMLRRRCGTEE